MWNYEKRLQYPVKITHTNPKIAQVIITQFGGPDGELAASMRYLSQRYSMPYKEVMGTLTDIGTEELAHMDLRNCASINTQFKCRRVRMFWFRQILCRSYACIVAAGGKWCAVDSNIFPV